MSPVITVQHTKSGNLSFGQIFLYLGYFQKEWKTVQISRAKYGGGLYLLFQIWEADAGGSKVQGQPQVHTYQISG